MLCTSEAATSICLSMEEGSSSSSSSIIQLAGGSISGSRVIDRYNPIIRDSQRTSRGPPPRTPCSSQLPPISPKPQNNKNRKSAKETKKKDSRKPLIGDDDKKRKSTSNEKSSTNGIKSSTWSCTRPGEFITPPGSSRYLLSEKNFLDGLSSDVEPIMKMVPSSVEASKYCEAVKEAADDEYGSPRPPPSSSSWVSVNQVVVLRVSLHCKGCERKMKKHISRMKGVTSFNIDFAAKKVTVVGDVTPLSVLASISKVKNAQLWSPTVASSSSKPNNMSNSDLIKNAKQLVLSHEKMENFSRNQPTIHLL